MGVKGAFPFFKKRGYVANRVCPRDVQEQKHLDMMALFFGYIATRIKAMLQQQHRKKSWLFLNGMEAEPATSLLSDGNLQRLALEINKKLEQDFDKVDCILHFDGVPIAEKQAEHTRRATRYTKDATAALANTTRITQRVNIIRGHNNPSVTSSDRTKLVK